MPDFTQKGKPMRVDTPLGADQLLLEKFECIEAVSSPYEMTLSLLSHDALIDFSKLLRKPITVSVDLPPGDKRIFHGMVRRIVQLGREEGVVTCSVEAVPSLWFLSLGTDCRIFQQKNVPDIIKEVLTDAGVTDVRNALTGSYPVRDYCVQYRESHLDFISRLMEEEGIFYFFEHTKAKHTMVLADSSSVIKAGSVGSLRMQSVAGAALAEDVISELTVDTAVRSTGAITLMDYNDTTAKRLEGTAKGKNVAGASQLSQFDYPGKFAAKPDGERLARVRIEEAESLAHVIDAHTACRAIRTGTKLDITEHYRRDVNGSYQILSAHHSATEGSYRSSDDSVSFSFETGFRAMPHDVPYRPRRVTPKSIVHGSQTAVVVGPSGQEIYVDKYGRVKVQFYWDHLGKNDEKSSCWVRVSSTWAGKQWGFIQIPRIGQEVVVDFLEGDPDRPLIVGRVYNGEQMPPYDLPDNHTQSGIKTRSSPNGASADANEIRFEDKKGSEQLLVHAQKDFVIEVENDQTIAVMHDRTLSVDNDETTQIKGKRTETVQKDEAITYTEGNQSVMFNKGDQVLVIAKGKQEITVEGNRTIKVKTGSVATEVSKGNVETNVSMGNVTMKVSAGQITYDAIKGIEIKCGPNSIKLAPDGITIKGVKVAIQADTMADIKGLMTSVKADAMLTVKGGITMIN